MNRTTTVELSRPARPTRARRRRLAVALVAVAALASAACSVDTPRDGFTVAADGRGGSTPGAGAGSIGTDGSGIDTGDALDGSALDGTAPGSGSDTGSGGGVRRATGSGPTGPGGATPTTAGGGGGGGAPSGPTPGVSQEEIVVSLVAGWSGVYSAVSEEFFRQGFVTWQNEINQTGGIHGRRVVVKKVDTKDTADGGVGACREAAANGSYLVVVWAGLGDATGAATDCLDKQGVTNLTMSEPSASWQHSYTSLASNPDQGRALASLVKNVMNDGSKKLGVIYVTDPVYESMKDAYVGEAGNLGMDVVATEAVEPNQASFTSQLLRLRGEGVENLAIFATVEAIGILRDARALGWNPRFAGAAWMYDFIAQAARDTATNVHGVKLGVASDSPRFEEFRQKRDKYNPSNTPVFTDATLAYGYALLIGKVLDAAGPNPTKESLVSGLHSIQGYDNGFLPPIAYGPTDRIGPRASFPVVCCTSNATWRGLGPARESF